MMTKERNDILAKHAKELAEFDLKQNILAALPACDVPVDMVHVHSLYGSSASINYGSRYRGYGDDKPRPTWETVLQLAEALPAVSMVKIKDGCLSFQPRGYYDALPEAKKERVSEETDIAPFLVQWEPDHGALCKVEWFTDLPGVGIVEIEIVIATSMLPAELGRYSARRIEYRGGFRWDDCQLRPSDDAITLLRDGEPMAQCESPIRWAAGSSEYQNKFTMYWVNLRADKSATPADLARSMIEARNKRAAK